MEISRTLLKTMLREFWALNNETCENVTILFLRRLDLTDKEIKKWIRINPKDRDLEDVKDILDEAIKDTENYYYEEE